MATPASVSMDGLALTRRIGWRAALAPSLTDFFFLCAIAWMFMAADTGWQSLLRDGDTGIHIRIGDLILASHHVPATDPFSFSKPGETWFAHEWLTAVFYALLVRAAGLKGLVLLTGAVLALYNTILLLDVVKRGANSLVAIALVLAGTNATSIHFHTRPHVFTLAFLDSFGRAHCNGPEACHEMDLAPGSADDSLGQYARRLCRSFRGAGDRDSR